MPTIQWVRCPGGTTTHSPTTCCRCTAPRLGGGGGGVGIGVGVGVGVSRCATVAQTGLWRLDRGGSG